MDVHQHIIPYVNEEPLFDGTNTLFDNSVDFSDNVSDKGSCDVEFLDRIDYVENDIEVKNEDVEDIDVEDDIDNKNLLKSDNETNILPSCITQKDFDKSAKEWKRFFDKIKPKLNEIQIENIKILRRRRQGCLHARNSALKRKKYKVGLENQVIKLEQENKILNDTIKQNNKCHAERYSLLMNKYILLFNMSSNKNKH